MIAPVVVSTDVRFRVTVLCDLRSLPGQTTTMSDSWSEIVCLQVSEKCGQVGSDIYPPVIDLDLVIVIEGAGHHEMSLRWQPAVGHLEKPHFQKSCSL